MEWSAGEKNQSRSFRNIYFNLSIYLRKTRTHCILIKTGKAELVVPAALFVTCPALSGCMAGACWRLCTPELGMDCECCCSTSPTSLSWHSQHYFRVKSGGKNVIVQLTGTLLFLFILLGDLIFSFSFSSFLYFNRRSGVAAISMVMMLLWQNVLQACAFLDWLKIFDLLFSGYETTSPASTETSPLSFRHYLNSADSSLCGQREK